MTENFDASQHESIAQTEPNLSELKKEVEITPSTLKEITLKQEFLERVIELSSNAKESINIQRAKEALVYLNQAEKILEYAASCGKTIDKYIIISVLHNIACCHQKIWELDKCSQYLEALIFNFNSFMKSADHNASDDSSSSKNKDKSKRSQDSILAEGLDRKTFLSKYYLQFCAVNSQTDNHSGALIAGRKSIQIMKSLFKQMAEMAASMKKMTYEKRSQFQYKMRLIQLGSRVNDSININHYQTIYQAAKYYLRQWRMQKDNKDRIDRNYVLQQQFKNYSIGNAMQINPMTYRQFQERDTKNYTSKMILQKILLMALGYFTISTELRLIATKKTKLKEGERASTAEFKESEIYHLLSIIIAASCIPFEILYMKHVLSSYANHYGGDLSTEESDSRIKENKYEEFIFPAPQQSTRKITTNNSFTGSIQAEDTISKFEKEDEEHLVSKEMLTERRKEENSKDQETIKHDPAKKLKTGLKNKSKSKSKNMKSMTFLGHQERSQKASPMPKSPNAHLRSPVSKNNLIKVKTSYKVKVSTEKIVTTNNPNTKEEKSRKKKEVRAQNIEFDYFMGRSKDLKKMKKNIESGLNLASPRANNASKSSSKRQSPIPKYFQQLKPQSPMMKSLKSPRKNTAKGTKNNFQQYYL